MKLEQSIESAIAALNRGDVIGVPTETVYGLAADAANPGAVARTYRLKRRPNDRALPLAIGDPSWLARAVEDVPPEAQRLADAFWPGPLTLVLAKPRPEFAHLADARGTLAVRMPSNPVLRALLQKLDRGLVLTSANIHGTPDALNADQVSSAFGSEVPLIIDGGPCPLGKPSTIVEVLPERSPRVLRVGSLDPEDLDI